MAATRELLFEQGLAGFSMDDVARRAGVGRQSVYRRWRSKAALAITAVTWSIDARDAFPDRGSFEADLRSGLQALAELYAQSSASVFADVYAAMAGDPAARALFFERYLQPRRESLRCAIQRGIERGELATTTDVEIVSDLVSGPFLHRLLGGAGDFSDGLVEAVVGAVLGLYGVTPSEEEQR